MARPSRFQTDEAAEFLGQSPDFRNEAFRLDSIHAMGGRTAALSEIDIRLGLDPFIFQPARRGLRTGLASKIATILQAFGYGRDHHNPARPTQRPAKDTWKVTLQRVWPR